MTDVFLAGLHTTFANSPVGVAVLREVYDLGVRLARLDVQGCAVPMMHALIQEALDARLTPLVIVDGAQQIADLEPLAKQLYGVEYLNEPDGRISVADYRKGMRECWDVAQAVGVPLYVPALSNLNENSLQYLNDLRPFPVGVKFSVHRYGDGTFEQPHRGFASRANEVKWLRAAIGWDAEWGVSEFGYPTIDGLTEAMQAERVAQEWAFWAAQGAAFAVLYQISDGPHAVREGRYGIRALNPDGSWRWKPVAFTFPRVAEPEPPAPAEATFAVVVSNDAGVPIEHAGVILSLGLEGFTNQDGYLPFQIPINTPFNFSVHREGYQNFVSEARTIADNTDALVTLVRTPQAFDPVQLATRPRAGMSIASLIVNSACNIAETVKRFEDAGVQWTRVNLLSALWTGVDVLPFRQRPDGQWDLYDWNAQYFDRLAEIRDRMNGANIVVQWTAWELYSWSSRKPGPQQTNTPWRHNVNGVFWSPEDTTLTRILPDAWSVAWLERVLPFLRLRPNVFEIGNEMPEKSFHARLLAVVRRIQSDVLVSVNRQEDTPGQYLNMEIGRAGSYDLIAFHGARLKTLGDLDRDYPREPDYRTFRAFMDNCPHDPARVIFSSDGARTNTATTSKDSPDNPYDWDRLREWFREMRRRGYNIEHQSRSKLSPPPNHDHIEVDFFRSVIA